MLQIECRARPNDAEQILFLLLPLLIHLLCLGVLVNMFYNLLKEMAPQGGDLRMGVRAIICK